MPGAPRCRACTGFTLIELMIVIGLISILAGILLPSFQRARSQANLTSCCQNLRNLATTVTMYQVDNKGLLPNEVAVSNGTGLGTYLTSNHPQLRKYLPKTPKCPLERARTYSYRLNIYKSATGASYYQILCYTYPSLHQDLGCPNAFPRWSFNYPGYPNGLTIKP